jgi:hypothetical protein
MKNAVFCLIVVSVAMSGAKAQGAHDGYRGLQGIRYANPYCESAGNIHAISYGGTYRGKWQFDQQTWNTYAPTGWWWDGKPGHHGDPAYAPERIQDLAALRVPYDAWPNC